MCLGWVLRGGVYVIVRCWLDVCFRQIKSRTPPKAREKSNDLNSSFLISHPHNKGEKDPDLINIPIFLEISNFYIRGLSVSISIQCGMRYYNLMLNF